MQHQWVQQRNYGGGGMVGMGPPGDRDRARGRANVQPAWMTQQHQQQQQLQQQHQQHQLQLLCALRTSNDEGRCGYGENGQDSFWRISSRISPIFDKNLRYFDRSVPKCSSSGVPSRFLGISHFRYFYMSLKNRQTAKSKKRKCK